MNPKFVLIHPSALEEAEAATDWCALRSRQVAEAFLDELRRAMQQISEHPEKFPVLESGTRRIVLRKFPYLVIFRETATAVQIVAVAHGRRRPNYWRDRIR